MGQLWGTEAFETDEVADRLADASLLQLDLRDNTIEVHDVLTSGRARTSQRSPVAPPPSGGIVGRPERTARGRCLYLALDAYHVAAAGVQDRLRPALFDPVWIERRLSATNLDTLIRDYDLFPDDAAADAVQEALRLQGRRCSATPTQVAAQLLGRLLGAERPDLRLLLERARTARPVRLAP